MNERIDELFGKALDKAVPYTWTSLSHLDVESVINVFTELVVNECCKTLEEMHRWQSVNNQNYPSAWHDAVDQGIENIKQHFGV